MKDGYRDVMGVLLLRKDPGMSSNAALQKARRLYRAAKAGHTGTLDPFAEGLLPVCFGEATKFAQRCLDADKEYVATSRVGLSTDTLDLDGRPVAQSEATVDEGRLRAAVAGFVGEIWQTPPMASALKRDGKPLYKYLREGVEVERAPRRVTIRSLDLLSVEPTEVRARVACSKGTYIRVLMSDLLKSAGCESRLTRLVRSRLGDLRVENAWGLDELARMGEDRLMGVLLQPDVLLFGMPRADFAPGSALALINGKTAVAEEPEALARLASKTGAGTSAGTIEFKAYRTDTGGFIGLVEPTFRASGECRPARMMSAASAGFGP